MKLFRLTVLAAALCLTALTAPAAAAGPPAGTPSATSNPGSAHAPTQEQARAQARRSRVTPREACSGLGLSRKREEGERRSDFNACVVAVARGSREGEEGVTASA